MPPNFEPRPPASPNPTPPPERPNMPPPTPNNLRQAHSMPVGEQHLADPNNLPKVAGQNLFQNDAHSTNSGYDFIFNHQQPKQSLNLAVKLPSNPFGKIAVVVGGLIILVILFNVVSGLLKGPSSLPELMSVLEDQQELIHISNDASGEPDLSDINQNFTATASLSLSSSSSLLQSYITTAGDKVNPNDLLLKESRVTDSTLTGAEAAGDFNSTFTQVANEQLTNYINDLKIAYAASKGPKGQALLKNDYNQAKLLQTSLNST